MTLTSLNRETVERIMCERLPQEGEVWTHPKGGSVQITNFGANWVRGVFSLSVVDYRWLDRGGARRVFMHVERFVELFKAPEAT